MLEKLLPSFPKICNTVVEPSVAQIDLFKQRVEEHHELEGVTFNWIPQTSDDYLQSGENTTQSKKFHLITAVHVLYYATDLKDTVRRLHDLLEDGGILFIIIGSSRYSSSISLRSFPVVVITFSIYQGSPFNVWFPMGPWDKNKLQSS